MWLFIKARQIKFIVLDDPDPQGMQYIMQCRDVQFALFEIND